MKEKMENKFKYNVSNLNDKYNFFVHSPSTIHNPKNNSIIFLKKNSVEMLENLKEIKESIIILLENIDGGLLEKENLILYDKNPRYRYAKLITSILEENKKDYKKFYKDGYYYGENVKIGKNVMIEPFTKIGNNVFIGDNTIIRSGTVIRDNVIIGNNCFIKENSVIGSEGFGIEKDENKNNFRIPHLGGVIIENNVEIGSLTTICAGTIDPTIIRKFTKIDDHVHIAHNVIIGKNSLIVAGSVIGGSTQIEENAWIGINSAIKNGIKIGKNVTTGMGSRVLHSVNDNETLTNEKADTLENVIKFTKYKQNILKEMNGE